MRRSEVTRPRVGAIQTDVVFSASLFKGRVEAGFRVPWDAPPKRWPHAGGHAACKAGGICGGGKFADAYARNDRNSPSITFGEWRKKTGSCLHTSLNRPRVGYARVTRHFWVAPLIPSIQTEHIDLDQLLILLIKMRDQNGAVVVFLRGIEMDQTGCK